MFAFVGPFGLSVLQMVVILALLGLVAGLIDRAPVIDAGFKVIIRWFCLVTAVILLVLALMSGVGLI